MLIVSPSALMTMMEVRIDSGIDTAMINVLRQLPRKIRIIRPVSNAAIRPSRNTPLIEARTKIDWSARGWICSSGGSCSLNYGQAGPLCPEMISRVEAFPVSDRQQRCSIVHLLGQYWSAVETRLARRLHRGCRPWYSQPLLIGRSFNSPTVLGYRSDPPDIRTARSWRSARQNQVLRADGVDDVHRRQP